MLKEVFIDQNKKTRKPSYIIPEVSSKERIDDLDGGLDIVLQRFLILKSR